MTKKLPEKISLGNIKPKYHIDIEVRQSINELIDYLKDKDFMEGLEKVDTDTEENGDKRPEWVREAFRHYLKNVSKNAQDEVWEDEFYNAILACVPKPVEQELIPLDVEKIVEEVYPNLYGTQREELRNLLSKYGVHKQEAIEIPVGCKCNLCGVENKNLERSYYHYCTPTPQATSVDVEEVADKIRLIMYPNGKTNSYLVKDKHLKDSLSSLPIQKKRSKQTILDWFDKRDGKFHTQNQHIKELDKILSD